MVLRRRLGLPGQSRPDRYRHAGEAARRTPPVPGRPRVPVPLRTGGARLLALVSAAARRRLRRHGIRALAGDPETWRRPDRGLAHARRAAVLRVVDLPHRRHHRPPSRDPGGRPCRRHVCRRWAPMGLERPARVRRAHPADGGEHQLRHRRRGGAGDRRPVPGQVLAGRTRVRPRSRRLPGLAGYRRGYRRNVHLDRPRLSSRRAHQPLGDDVTGDRPDSRLPRRVRTRSGRRRHRRPTGVDLPSKARELSRRCGW